MSKRDSYLPAKDLRPPLGTPKQEAAKWLKDAARDFLNERITETAVTEAVQNWLAVTVTDPEAPELAAIRARYDATLKGFSSNPGTYYESSKDVPYLLAALDRRLLRALAREAR